MTNTINLEILLIATAFDKLMRLFLPKNVCEVTAAVHPVVRPAVPLQQILLWFFYGCGR